MIIKTLPPFHPISQIIINNYSNTSIKSDYSQSNTHTRGAQHFVISKIIEIMHFSIVVLVTLLGAVVSASPVKRYVGSDQCSSIGQRQYSGYGAGCCGNSAVNPNADGIFTAVSCAPGTCHRTTFVDGGECY